jgi:hypothetical protein
VRRGAILIPMVIVLGVPAAAGAGGLVIATTPETPAPALAVEPPGPPPTLGFDAVFGAAGQVGGKDGWFARLQYWAVPEPKDVGVTAVLGWGFEWWRSGDDNWGFSMPFSVAAVMNVAPVRVAVGGGIDYFVTDQVDDDTGFALVAPHALGRLTIDLGGVELGADARIGYRWLHGAPNQGRWQVGFFIGGSFEGPPPRRSRRYAAR